jgi:hypothetical protein
MSEIDVEFALCLINSLMHQNPEDFSRPGR